MKSFRIKMLCILLGMSLLPFIAGMMYSYRIISRTLQEKIDQSTASYMESLVGNVDREIQYLVNDMEISTSVYYVQHAINQLDKLYTDGERWLAIQNLNEIMLRVFGDIQAVAGIYITIPDGTTYAVWDRYHENLAQFSQSDWFNDQSQRYGAVTLRGIKVMADGRKAIIFGKLLRDLADTGGLQRIGYIHFALDPSFFSIVSSPNEENEATFLLSQEGECILSVCGSEKEEIYLQALEEERVGMDAEQEQGVFSIRINGERMAMICSVSPNYHFQAVRFIPYSVYWDEAMNVTWIVIAFSLFCIISAVLISFLMARGISKPVQMINRVMQYTETGHFDARLPEDREDELGAVMKSYNHMVCQLERLFRQSVENEKQKMNLEIRSLQYQINPHFLYNLLASVRSLAVVEHAGETAEMLGAVSALMKNTVGYAGRLIPLCQEAENIRLFLKVQNFCHSGLIHWRMEIEKGTESFHVPNLIMQPVVENAVFYGADPDSGEVELDIQVNKEGKALLIIISDHGSGIPKEKQKEIFREQGNQDGISHVGLYNTRERIRVNFGEPYDLVLDSDSGGTRVMMRFPLLLGVVRERKEEEE